MSMIYGDCHLDNIDLKSFMDCYRANGSMELELSFAVVPNDEDKLRGKDESEFQYIVEQLCIKYDNALKNFEKAFRNSKFFEKESENFKKDLKDNLSFDADFVETIMNTVVNHKELFVLSDFYSKIEDYHSFKDEDKNFVKPNFDFQKLENKIDELTSMLDNLKDNKVYNSYNRVDENFHDIRSLIEDNRNIGWYIGEDSINWYLGDINKYENIPLDMKESIKEINLTTNLLNRIDNGYYTHHSQNSQNFDLKTITSLNYEDVKDMKYLNYADETFDSIFGGKEGFELMKKLVEDASTPSRNRTFKKENYVAE